MRLLVTGSRTYDDALTVEETLSGIYVVHSVGWQTAHLEPFHLIHGGASGADMLAERWAIHSPLSGPVYFETPPEDLWDPAVRGCPIVIHRVKADWSAPCDPDFCHRNHRKPRKAGGTYCPAAGLLRNERMAAKYDPDRAVAFIDKPLPKSRGTADMVHRLETYDIPTRVIRTQT